MVIFGHSDGGKTTGAPGLKDEIEEYRGLSNPHYGSICGDTCPTCRGTGRIPRGHGDQLVAVISCNDKRLKPRHTKLYMCISMAVCLFVSGLTLFFLFPRSVTITPVSVQSVMVYFTTQEILNMEVKNLINISNQNYLPVQIVEVDLQGLISYTVMGRNKICNMTAIEYRSQKTYTVQIDLEISDPGLNSYCRSNSIKIHTLFLELQVTMNITYLSHAEQVSLNTFEYIDCGANSTIPHPMEGGR